MMEPKRFHFDIVTSTNDYVKELLFEEEFVIVTANYQTQGKGRNNNVWIGDYGKNLYCSFGIRFKNLLPPQNILHFQSLSALAVLKTLQELCLKQRFVLKYPNDIYALDSKGEFRKISGILVEHSFVGELCQSVIIGIGINVWQIEFPNFENNNPTSLALMGEFIEIEHIIQKLTQKVIQYIAEEPKKIISEWQNHLNIIGKKIKILGKDGKFFVDGFDSFGRLIVSNIHTSEVTLIDNGDSIRYELK